MTQTITDQDLEDRVHHVLGFLSAKAEEEADAVEEFSAPVIAATAAWLTALQFAIDAPEEWARIVRGRVEELADGDVRMGARLVAWVVERGDAGEVGEYLSSVVAERDLAADE